MPVNATELGLDNTICIVGMPPVATVDGRNDMLAVGAWAVTGTSTLALQWLAGNAPLHVGSPPLPAIADTVLSAPWVPIAELSTATVCVTAQVCPMPKLVVGFTQVMSDTPEQLQFAPLSPTQLVM